MILFRVLGTIRHDGEIRIKRTKGVDGADVSYPGADGGAVGGSSRRERYSVPGTAPLG